MSNYATLNIKDVLAPGWVATSASSAPDYSMRVWLDREDRGAHLTAGEW